MHSQFSFDEMKSRYAVERRQPCQIIRADDQLPLMAQTRSAGMSAMPPLLGDKRTSRGEPISVAIDPMYGPAVRCKRFSSSWHSAVLHQCIRSLLGAVLLRTIMDISARAFSLADRPQRAIWVTSFRMRRGRPILHLFSSSRRPRQVTC